MATFVRTKKWKFVNKLALILQEFHPYNWYIDSRNRQTNETWEESRPKDVEGNNNLIS